jgi:antirestriction protein ArdC/phage/plasmid primase-like uncharacterized protein
MSKARNVAAQFAAEIIEQLKAGTAPWQKPWDADVPQPPFNPITGTVYRGINRVTLGGKGYADPRWMTLRQANEEGYRVKKGAKSSKIVFWHWSDEKKVLDNEGKPIMDAEGKPVMEKLERSRPLLQIYSVFHASQLQTEDGKDLPLFAGKELTWNPIEKAEEILKNSGASIAHDQRDRAYYSLTKDEIHLPPKERFSSEDRYYSTALHELGHWTGHSSRMNREFGPFGSETYAKEELRAEISSWMMSQELGIPHDPAQHVAYVDSWVKVLENNPYEILYACQTAEKMTEHVMALEQQQQMTNQPAHQELAAEINRAMADGGRWDDLAAGREANKHAAASLQALADGDERRALESMKLAVEVETNHAANVGPTFAGCLAALRESHCVYTLGNRAGVSIEFTDAVKAAQAFHAAPAVLEPYVIRTAIRYGKEGAATIASTSSMGYAGENKSYGKSADGAIDPKFYAAYRALNPQKTEPGLERPSQSMLKEKTYLNVSFKEKEQAKAAGAKWDRDAKLWYAPEGTPEEKIVTWLPAPEKTASPALPPVEEFGEAIRQAGLLLEGLPVMDGQIHRVPVISGKTGATDGSYCGYTDGRPNGWIRNFKTGLHEKWIATGQMLSADEKISLEAGKTERLHDRKMEKEARAAKAMKRAYAVWMNAHDVQEHGYLDAKGVDNFGLKQDKNGNLLIPAYDLQTGRIQTLQRIGANGSKKFEKDCPKEGACFLISTNDEGLDLNNRKLLLAEGYATGASLHMATGQPVAVAFDSGNLLSVAIALRTKYPNVAITICADNDKPNEHSENIGVEKANEAAAAVGGKVVIPAVTNQEKNIGLTDFNDIHRTRGLSAVAEQVANKKHEIER